MYLANLNAKVAELVVCRDAMLSLAGSTGRHHGMATPCQPVAS